MIDGGREGGGENRAQQALREDENSRRWVVDQFAPRSMDWFPKSTSAAHRACTSPIAPPLPQPALRILPATHHLRCMSLMPILRMVSFFGGRPRSTSLFTRRSRKGRSTWRGGGGKGRGDCTLSRGGRDRGEAGKRAGGGGNIRPSRVGEQKKVGGQGRGQGEPGNGISRGDPRARLVR